MSLLHTVNTLLVLGYINDCLFSRSQMSFYTPCSLMVTAYMRMSSFQCKRKVSRIFFY